MPSGVRGSTRSRNKGALIKEQILTEEMFVVQKEARAHGQSVKSVIKESIVT